MNVEIEPSWQAALASEFEKDYFLSLRESVRQSYETTTVFPPSELIFNAFNLCSLPSVKVVILGQDPYHGHGQAMGLSFSVPTDEKVPPSLRNIYKEVVDDLGTEMPYTGDLRHWAKQGVLLLNATLTVAADQPGSHQGLGWEQFTDAVIETISDEKEHVVFLLWGAYAAKKAVLIDTTEHLVLTAPHPSPLSAHRGFFGCRHFSATNQYLERHHQKPIQW